MMWVVLWYISCNLCSQCALCTVANCLPELVNATLVLAKFISLFVVFHLLNKNNI
jgi:hypothetical protein